MSETAFDGLLDGRVSLGLPDRSTLEKESGLVLNPEDESSKTSQKKRRSKVKDDEVMEIIVKSGLRGTVPEVQRLKERLDDHISKKVAEALKEASGMTNRQWVEMNTNFEGLKASSHKTALVQEQIMGEVLSLREKFLEMTSKLDTTPPLPDPKTLFNEEMVVEQISTGILVGLMVSLQGKDQVIASLSKTAPARRPVALNIRERQNIESQLKAAQDVLEDFQFKKPSKTKEEASSKRQKAR